MVDVALVERSVVSVMVGLLTEVAQALAVAGYRCESKGEVGEVNRYGVEVVVGCSGGGYERLAVEFDMGRVRVLDEMDFVAWLGSMVTVLELQCEG